MMWTTGVTQGPHPACPAGLTFLDKGDGVVAVVLSDATVLQSLHDLRWRLAPLIMGGTDTLEIDVAGLHRLSSVSIATLLWVKRTCAARQIRVVLNSPTKCTLDQLRRTGLASVLEIGSQAS